MLAAERVAPICLDDNKGNPGFGVSSVLWNPVLFWNRCVTLYFRTIYWKTLYFCVYDHDLTFRHHHRHHHHHHHLRHYNHHHHYHHHHHDHYHQNTCIINYRWRLYCSLHNETSCVRMLYVVCVCVCVFACFRALECVRVCVLMCAVIIKYLTQQI